MRVRSQFTGRSMAKSASIARPGDRQSQFVDHLREDGLEWLAGLAFERDAAAKPTASEIQHVVDHRGHPLHGGLHHRDDLMFFFALNRPPENARASADGGERIAEVVTKHRDELFSQFASSHARPQELLRGLFRRDGRFSAAQKLLFVAPPVRRLDESQTDAERLVPPDRAARSRWRSSAGARLCP